MLDFLGIGAQKSGTTWLHQNLVRHPDLFLPPSKELHFWDRRDLLDLAWYEGNFSGHKHQICGEITPAYGILPIEIINEIYKLYPNLRLIYLLRNPIDRAWSAARMALIRAELQPGEASDQWFIDHFQSLGSQSRGDYEACIRTWRQVFPEQQLKIIYYDDICRAPGAVLQSCCRHLAISPLPQDLLPLASQRHFAGPPVILRDSLNSVLRNLYREKIQSLESYLDTDLSHWLAEGVYA